MTNLQFFHKLAKDKYGEKYLSLLNAAELALYVDLMKSKSAEDRRENMLSRGWTVLHQRP